LALRHLCENNPENQKAIEELKIQGVSETPEELQNMGLKLDIEGGKIRIKKVEM